VRDTFGLVGDSLGDPISWILPFPGGIVRTGTDGIDQRARYIDEIDQLRRDSIDFYATLRSISRQRRRAQVDRGEGQRQDIPRVVSDAEPSARPPAATDDAPPAPPAPRAQTRPVAQQTPARPQPARRTVRSGAADRAVPAAPAPQAERTPWVMPQAAMAAVPQPALRNAAPIRVRPDGSWVVDPRFPSQGR
jgi:hypothetical protein